MAIEGQALPPGTVSPINVGFGQPKTVLNLVDSIATVLCVEQKIRHVDKPAVDAHTTRAHPGQMRELIGGWQPIELKTSIEHALSSLD